ncbi:MAG: phosphatase PAP2 family protein [Flavisolibacter sp.]
MVPLSGFYRRVDPFKNLVNAVKWMILLVLLTIRIPSYSQSPNTALSRNHLISQNLQSLISNLNSKDSVIPDEKTTPHLYKMHYGFTIPFALIATGANLYAIPKIIHAKQNLTDVELQSLNPSIFSAIDRWALNLNPANRDKFYKTSDIVLPVIIASAGTLAFDKQIRKDWWRILMMYYEMHAVTFTIYNFSPFGPAFQNKLRPVVYYDYFTLDERRGGNQRNSMYSGHVASGTASTFFMVKVYSDYHPELGGKKYLLYALASIPPLFEGYLRVKALAHFPSDVMIGYIIGAFTGITVPQLHKFKDQQLHLGLNYSSGGPGINLVWNPSFHKKLLPDFIKRSPLNAFASN